MAAEIELKLSVHPLNITTLLQLPELSAASENRKYDLCNQYYDTTDQLLTKQKAALRIRQKDRRFIQTLKTRGENIGGLHQRQEWEWELPVNQLDLSLISEYLPKDLDLSSLKPLFCTDFTRHEFVIQCNQSRIELVVDQGLVTGSEQSETISEVELELLEGNVHDLYALALKLSQKVALIPSDVSKAERGYRLINGLTHKKNSSIRCGENSKALDFFQQLFANELETLGNHWHTFIYAQDVQQLAMFRRCLSNLRSLLEFFAPILANVELARIFVQRMTKQFDQAVDWLPDANVLTDSQEVSDVLPYEQWMDSAKELNNNCDFSMYWLQLSSWLHGQGWRINEHAGLTVKEFVPEQLQAEWKALDLRACRFSISKWLSAKSRAAIIELISRQLRDLYLGLDINKQQLSKLNGLLAELAASEALIKEKNWLHTLDEHQQAAVYAQGRKNTVLVGALNRLSRSIAPET